MSMPSNILGSGLFTAETEDIERQAAVSWMLSTKDIKTIQSHDWEFVVKLDGDLSFESDYFEKCFENFESESRLGVGGGVICYVVNGVKKFEKCPAFHVRGATKIYRRRLLGRDWRVLARTWLGHDGRSKSQYAGLDNKEFFRPSYSPPQVYRYGGGLVGRPGQERQGELHLWLSSSIYALQMPAPTYPTALYHWFYSAILWIHHRIFEADSSSE